jgi:hypothetical protein
VENIAAASGGKALSLNGSPTTNGSASFIFQGITGYYDVSLGTFDENDGKARFSLDRNGGSIGSLVLDQQLPSAAPNSTTKTTLLTSSRVLIGKGDTITVKGFADGGEFARLDFINFIQVPVM